MAVAETNFFMNASANLLKLHFSKLTFFINASVNLLSLAVKPFLLSQEVMTASANFFVLVIRVCRRSSFVKNASAKLLSLA